MATTASARASLTGSHIWAANGASIGTGPGRRGRDVKSCGFQICVDPDNDHGAVRGGVSERCTGGCTQRSLFAVRRTIKRPREDGSRKVCFAALEIARATRYSAVRLK